MIGGQNKIQIYMETSQQRPEKCAGGFDVSYDSSLSGVKAGIFNFKGGNTRAAQAISLERPPYATASALSSSGGAADMK